uniref:Uncharacterized protein n=1 Tax=Rhizophora mucronata TaxID=61149 RepID=A0A2P2MZ32_RHIMU
MLMELKGKTGMYFTVQRVQPC